MPVTRLRVPRAVGPEAVPLARPHVRHVGVPDAVHRAVERDPALRVARRVVHVAVRLDDVDETQVHRVRVRRRDRDVDAAVRRRVHPERGDVAAARRRARQRRDLGSRLHGDMLPGVAAHRSPAGQGRIEST
ncbi:hypothetical protein JCM11754A_02390 [Isoptericola variabilis]